MSGSVAAGGPHDLGGLVPPSPVKNSEEAFPNLQDPAVASQVKDKPEKHWEMQVNALLVVLSCKKPKPLLTTDELRRGVEALQEKVYHSWGYYDRWAASMTNILIERGIISLKEMEDELSGDEAREGASFSSDPKFKTGNRVQVKKEDTRCRWRKPHLRTPGYIFGCSGTIERYCGCFPDPYYEAFRDSAPPQHLYRVRFLQRDLWPEYERGNDDTVDVEVYEGWLRAEDDERTFEEGGEDVEYRRAPTDECQDGLDHHSHHHHADDDHGHVHEARATVEQTAIEREGERTAGQAVGEALLRLLERKGIVRRDEINQVIAKTEEAHHKLLGARLVARAWVDSEFKDRLLADASKAAEELGIKTSNPNAPTVLTVVEDTPQVHNVIVCTLCSCYPSSILGFSPSWYKSRTYRSRVVREPRTVLAEFGTHLPPTVKIQVHDSTADNRYMVLPLRPEGTETWTEEALLKLVTRDSMIGVTLPKVITEV